MSRVVHAPRGTELTCKNWLIEAPYRMIQNNLDPRVAQHPYELVTYGGNGTVFQNWAQYLLTMKYLSEMTDSQTLHMYSGHPMGLFPSSPEDPRVVVTGEGLYVMAYTAWNQDIARLSIAFSKDLVHWEKKGPAFARAYDGRYLDHWSKSGSILTKLENDKQVAHGGGW